MTNEFVRMGAWELTMQITKSFQQEIGAFSTSFSLLSFNLGRTNAKISYTISTLQLPPSNNNRQGFRHILSWGAVGVHRPP